MGRNFGNGPNLNWIFLDKYGSIQYFSFELLKPFGKKQARFALKHFEIVHFEIKAKNFWGSK